VECQLFCKCSNFDSDPLLAAKVPIWTVYEYRSCNNQCGSACICSQCSDNEFCCNNCFLALKAIDIDSDAENFMQIFEDEVAAAYNTVSKFTDAVISMESDTVQEEVNAMIVADLQECIGPDSKKRFASYQEEQ